MQCLLVIAHDAISAARDTYACSAKRLVSARHRILVDYLLGDIFAALFTTSIYSQAWAILLLVALSFLLITKGHPAKA